jgi:geranylgeranyl pyrophosphate synthase
MKNMAHQGRKGHSRDDLGVVPRPRERRHPNLTREQDGLGGKKILPAWWQDAAAELRSYLAEPGLLTPELHDLVNAAIGKGRFLRSALAMQMLTWTKTRLTASERRTLVSLLGQAELVHAAACILDDLIDGDPQRRGVPSFYIRVGLPAAVLAALHMFARAMTEEENLIGSGGATLLTRTFDRMVVGEAHDALPAVATRRNISPRTRLQRALDKTLPLFGTVFWYVGHVGRSRGAPNPAECADFGERIGKLYQFANDYHDVFSTGALERGEPDEQVTVTLSLPFVCALQVGATRLGDLGASVTRLQLQNRYDRWREAGVERAVWRRVLLARRDAFRHFPGSAPEEIEQVLELLSSRQFWSYRYE